MAHKSPHPVAWGRSACSYAPWQNNSPYPFRCSRFCSSRRHRTGSFCGCTSFRCYSVSQRNQHVCRIERTRGRVNPHNVSCSVVSHISPRKTNWLHHPVAVHWSSNRLPVLQQVPVPCFSRRCMHLRHGCSGCLCGDTCRSRASSPCNVHTLLRQRISVLHWKTQESAAAKRCADESRRDSSSPKPLEPEKHHLKNATNERKSAGRHNAIIGSSVLSGRHACIRNLTPLHL